MARILVTGGPVPAKLDDVKIITNRFRGGLMFNLATDLSLRDQKVVYLSNKNNVRDIDYIKAAECGITIETFDDINDYQTKVTSIAPTCDGVVLGAAVANLIPLNPIRGKFPSHNYKPGDIIPIEFTIAPRIIDLVKQISPKSHLFGFKLLSHVDHNELIRAAYDVLLHSKSTAVFANDAKDLNSITMVTKERAEHQMLRHDIPEQIGDLLNDTYYSTVIAGSCDQEPLRQLMNKWQNIFKTTPEGYIFGTIALRKSKSEFYTTGRGKKELDRSVLVQEVDHSRRIIKASNKATLNAPLLNILFNQNPDVKYIVHAHMQIPELKTLRYAPPGTGRDSMRPEITSFNICNHGCFLLLDQNFKIKGLPNVQVEDLRIPDSENI